MRPIGPKESFVAAGQRALGQLGDSVERLCDETNRVLDEVVGTADLPESKVHRAVGRFEMVLDELLDGYSELRELRPYRSHKRGHELLLVIYRYTLTRIQGWLLEVVEALADPMAALKKKGLPTSGEVQLNLSLNFTTPKENDELLDWIEQQTEAEERRAENAETQVRAIEEARLEDERKAGLWGALTGVVAGIFLGGLVFGDDD